MGISFSKVQDGNNIGHNTHHTSSIPPSTQQNSANQSSLASSNSNHAAAYVHAENTDMVEIDLSKNLPARKTKMQNSTQMLLNTIIIQHKKEVQNKAKATEDRENTKEAATQAEFEASLKELRELKKTEANEHWANLSIAGKIKHCATKTITVPLGLAGQGLVKIVGGGVWIGSKTLDGIGMGFSGVKYGIDSAGIAAGLVTPRELQLPTSTIATAIYKDDGGNIRAMNQQVDKILRITQKKIRLNIAQLTQGMEIPVVIELFDTDEGYDGFKQRIYDPFAESMTISTTVVKQKKDKNKPSAQAQLETFSTQESIIYSAVKAAIVRGENGFGEKGVIHVPKLDDNHEKLLNDNEEEITDNVPAYEFLASNPIRVHTDTDNIASVEIAKGIEQALNAPENKDLRAKLAAIKTLSLASGEQVDFKELAVILAFASALGIGGEFLGETIKHAVEKNKHGFVTSMIAGLPKGAAIAFIDTIENGINGYALISAELKKRGIDKITPEMIFGKHYKEMSPKQKLKLFMELALTGNIDVDNLNLDNPNDVKKLITATMGNMVNSALKGAGIGFLVSYMPLVFMSRDYMGKQDTHGMQKLPESVAKFLAINIPSTISIVTCTALSIPLETRNIMDRSMAAINHAFEDDMLRTDPAQLAQRMQFIAQETKEALTTSVASKSSIRAFMSVWTLAAIWVIHEKVVKGGIPDETAKLLFMAIVAPFENIWRAAWVGVDLATLPKKMTKLQNDVLDSLLNNEQLPDDFIAAILSTNTGLGITNNVLYPFLDKLTLTASMFKNLVTLNYGNQPRNRLLIDMPNISEALEETENKEETTRVNQKIDILKTELDKVNAKKERLEAKSNPNEAKISTLTQESQRLENKVDDLRNSLNRLNISSV
jgi:hypothetical protein